MKVENRWLYIGGVAMLAAVVVVGLVMRDRGREGEEGDAEVSVGDGDDVGRRADGSAETADGGERASRTEAGAVDDVGSVPSDPEQCRAYCGRLAERGALATGATAASCVAQLCTASPERDAGSEERQEPVPTISEPEVPDMPEDCQAQCRLLQQRGELRQGTTLEDCFAALCSTGEGTEEEEE